MILLLLVLAVVLGVIGSTSVVLLGVMAGAFLGMLIEHAERVREEAMTGRAWALLGVAVVLTILLIVWG